MQDYPVWNVQTACSTRTSNNAHKRGKLSLPLPQLWSPRESCSTETNRGYSDKLKRECLKIYVNGMGLRAIERGDCVFIIQLLLLG